MHERGKAGEGGLIECQTCEKKNLCSKKNFRTIFLEIFFIESYSFIYLNYFYHFQPFLYYKKCVRLKEVIRRDFDQCVDSPDGFEILEESQQNSDRRSWEF